ncbi:DUF2267 domain-containing protein [Martelella soudanensis]|uniref:DUF2267 domain-containing protein n=1 Tax=unclassified Martelella TaxID=2629616 RepID=UPI0015DE4E9E|nr:MULTISPECIES: DUF2267 domain-containing protein [unclassified Martelella]
MNTTISGFTQAADQAQEWVNELAEDLGWSERRAHRLLRSVLHALRDWLPEAEMADLAAQLPALVRGIYFEGWKPLETPVRDRRKEQFVARIQHDMASDPLDEPDWAIAAVFGLLDRHLDQGEIAQVRTSMKKALRQLWPTH